jgi:hypothetical protein
MWECVNDECGQVGIPKGSLDPLPPDAEVWCGECSELCVYAGPPA